MRIFSVLHIVLLGGHKSKRSVGTNGIVVGHIFLQFLVHFSEVVSVYHEVFVPHNELFFECSVETLDVRIHLWGTRIYEVMRNFVRNAVGVEVFEKFRTIVCLDARYFNINMLHDIACLHGGMLVGHIDVCFS